MTIVRKFLTPALLIVFLTIYIDFVVAQNLTSNSRYEKYIQKIGSTKIQNATLELLIVFRQDSALLLASVADAENSAKYIPLMTSVDSREMPAMDLSIYSSASNDKVWIYFQSTEDPKIKGVLSRYVLGSGVYESKLASFGSKLLDTPTPSHLSVSDRIVRGFGSSKVKKLATFHFSGREEASVQRR